ncbi:zinc finger, RING/FYVE/PHD-type containing protein [Tanacetum coccineum]
MFPASMRDILNHVQTMELDEDVAMLDGTFDIGIDQIRSIPRDQPTPGYNWMNNSGDAFSEGSYIMSDSESDDSDEYGWIMNEMVSEDYTDEVIESEDDTDEVNESEDDMDEVNEWEDMHHAVGPDTSDNSTGLSKETIMEHLQVSTLKTEIGGKGEGEKEEIDTCAICYGEYEESKKIGKLQCGHLFHVDCLISWLSRKNSCPMCRATALTV